MPLWMECGVASQVRWRQCLLVGEVLSLSSSPDELHDGEELLVGAALLQEAEAVLRHQPVHRARPVDVHGQEHNVLPLADLRCPLFQDLAKSL